jgi:hypothetical protein
MYDIYLVNTAKRKGYTTELPNVEQIKLTDGDVYNESSITERIYRSTTSPTKIYKVVPENDTTVRPEYVYKYFSNIDDAIVHQQEMVPFLVCVINEFDVYETFSSIPLK